VAPCRSCVNRRSLETSVHTRSTRRHIPEDGILYSHRCENLKSYISYKWNWSCTMVNIGILDNKTSTATTSSAFRGLLDFALLCYSDSESDSHCDWRSVSLTRCCVIQLPICALRIWRPLWVSEYLRRSGDSEEQEISLGAHTAVYMWEGPNWLHLTAQEVRSWSLELL
jgi:hypothetical protein